ncbi:MAG: EAL domain-containing protein [Nocardioidaceae bacterium]|nr:EAL domain-containing protein [Nocardioidaceae bacterium]
MPDDGGVLARTYLLVGGLVVVGVEELATSRLVIDLTYSLVGLSMIGAVLTGVRLHRPANARAWYLMAAAQGLWVIADATFNFQQDALGVDTFPTISDAFYLLGYPTFAAALLMLVRSRQHGRRDLGPLVDSATVTAGLSLLSWVLLARPTIESLGHSPAAAAVGAAYPAMDILLVAVLMRLLSSPGGHAPAFRYLLAALTLLITADTLSTAFDLFATNTVNGVEYLWLLSYVAWGAAALHPSMTQLSDSGANASLRFRGIRLTALVLATLIAPAILAVHQVAGVSVDAWAVIIGSVVLSLLVVVRMNLTVDQITAAHTTLEALQDELAVQASRDALTGLANRPQSLRLVAGALGRSRRHQRTVAVLFIDLDGFKDVNDTHGHRSGDEVLRQVARRMQEQLREGDFLGRLGGDEFVVGIEDLPGPEAATALGSRLIAAVSEPITLAAGVEVVVGASIGVALGRGGETDVETLLHEADVAVYRAKHAGRGCVQVYGEETPAVPEGRTELEQAVATAITRHELVLHYQPIVDLRTREVHAFEALVRWDRPGVGLLPPSQFLPVAEASDLICDLDAWVLRAAVDQLARWNEQRGDRTLQVSVNVSGRHASRARIVADVRSALHGDDVDAGQLVIEVTETARMDESAVGHLGALRQLGVLVSLDDYGTGYHSSAELARVPVDVVKIDRCFMDTETEAGRSLLELMVRTAHAFGSAVVVEGVECEEHAQFAREIGCEFGQGYHLGLPALPRNLTPSAASPQSASSHSAEGPPSSSATNPASSRIGTPSDSALSALEPAFSPTTT